MNKFSVFILLLMISEVVFSGNLQGGGGGPQNATFQHYLDKRLYSLDGAGREIMPRLTLINACKEVGDQKKLHTINKVWVCSGDSDSNGCLSKKKTHLEFAYPTAQKKCRQFENRILPKVGVKQVCVSEYDDKFVEFSTTYKLDVYRKNVGYASSPTRPNFDRDEFVRTIKYHIPDCTELSIK